MTDLLDTLTDKGLRRVPPSRAEALELLATTDDDLLDVVSAAFRVRRAFFGRKVKLNALINMKSGFCPEDCGYCSQRKGSDSGILKYSWISSDETKQTAERAAAAGVKRICLVASGRGPSNKDIERVANAIGAVKEVDDGLEVCVCLGLLEQGQAERLQAAGAYAYNHNLNTNESNYGRICSTHTYADRVETVARALAAGLSPCSGAIFGMGESDEDIVDLAFALREMQPDSVPVNFLVPFDGTPMAGQWTLSPGRCLRILALFRFFFPDVEVRVAGGRELHLRSLQPLAFHIANSVFLGDYLTSEGQPAPADLQMITDAGFTVEGVAEQTLPRPVATSAHEDLVVLRRRGPGTDIEANT